MMMTTASATTIRMAHTHTQHIPDFRARAGARERSRLCRRNIGERRQQQHQQLAIANFQVVTFPAGVAEVVSICVSSVCGWPVEEPLPYSGGQTPDGIRAATRVVPCSQHAIGKYIARGCRDVRHMIWARVRCGHMSNSRVLVRVRACREYAGCVCACE